MYTVSKRAKEYKQPRGGFLPPNSFETIKLDDGIELKEENISPSTVGIAVDYMSRFMEGASVEKAFEISIRGAKIIKKEEKAKELLKGITGLNDKSIISACKLTGFDTVLRAGPITYKPIEEINPDEDTIFNIITMIKRSQNFFKNYGPVINEGMTFLGGYTPTVISGDADFMTENTIWDFKVSKYPIKPPQTLQILMYYLMGCRTIELNAEYDFKNQIKNLGIYNPRKNEVYIKKISDIEKSVILEVEKEVIGYGDKIIDPHLKSILERLWKNKHYIRADKSALNFY